MITEQSHNPLNPSLITEGEENLSDKGDEAESTKNQANRLETRISDIHL